MFVKNGGYFTERFIFTFHSSFPDSSMRQQRHDDIIRILHVLHHPLQLACKFAHCPIDLASLPDIFLINIFTKVKLDILLIQENSVTANMSKRKAPQETLNEGITDFLIGKLLVALALTR